ncbi:MAG: CHAT domain-containing protein [Sphingomonadaceae bacterium]
MTVRNNLVKHLSLAGILGGILATSIVPTALTAQQQRPVSLRDSFPIGSNGLCEAQIMAPEPGAGIFDRRYSIICRDASAPIGTLWVLRGKNAQAPGPQFAGDGARCVDKAGGPRPDGLDRAWSYTCTSDDSIIRTSLLVGETGNRTFAASGFAAYEDALRIGIASLATDRIVPGTIEIPLTEASDAAAFARAQAQAISADQALAEAYRRSNSGRFAEAAEFFAASAKSADGSNVIEARLNEGLQQSNLGNFGEALKLFNSVRGAAATSPVLARMLRNYETLDALNRQNGAEALRIIDAPLRVDFEDTAELRQLSIGPNLSRRLSAESGSSLGGFSSTLTPLERAQLLDGQGSYLRAAALRLTGREQDAIVALEQAGEALADVRGGRVTSVVWLRAQILGELAELAERSGRGGETEALHQQGIALLDLHYPDAPVLQSARAQLAGYYARSGRQAEALGLYRDIVSSADGRPAPTLRGLLSPYFNLVLREGKGESAAADIFAASQLLQRPGLAQTQAVLARELSGGSDEASQLFRKATNVGRAIERLRSSILEMQTGGQLSPDVAALLAERTSRLEQLQREQAEIQQKLAEYPRYRAVSEGAVTLSALQSILRDGEAYVKVVNLDRETFVVYATKGEAMAWRADLTPAQMEKAVDDLRASIAITDGGEVLTFPFDIARSRELYQRLFAPVGDRLPASRHIVFEPDGALLRIPMNLLVTDDASVMRYQSNVAKGGDEYDFRGTAWLGRTSEISTSVSPAAFRDVRGSRQSRGTKSYLGLGQNEPIGAVAGGTGGTSSIAGAVDECQWAPSIWANPISSEELFTAAARFGGMDSGVSTVITRADFTDDAIKQKADLNQYRIVHFATHGLVTAPKAECPPRPALLTSFGEGDSDGLLTFAEIFSLQLDADLVVLSACDTAGSATVGATREAGVVSGGDFALDGLVRAFVGAGGRTVVASHWPVPDDYNATQRLISGLLAGDGKATAASLRESQIGLMDDADTSHPFYWSAFAIVGDGAITITR